MKKHDHKACVNICILNDGRLDIRYSCDSWQIPHVIGALHMAVKWFCELTSGMYGPAEMLNDNWMVRASQWVGPLVEKTKKVSKEEALWMYLKHRKRMEDRIQAINQADAKAEFEVPADLLNKL